MKIPAFQKVGVVDRLEVQGFFDTAVQDALRDLLIEIQGLAGNQSGKKDDGNEKDQNNDQDGSQTGQDPFSPEPFEDEAIERVKDHGDHDGDEDICQKRSKDQVKDIEDPDQEGQEEIIGEGTKKPPFGF